MMSLHRPLAVAPPARRASGRWLASLALLAGVAAGSSGAVAQESDAANVMPLTVKGLSKSYSLADGSIGTTTAFNRMVVSLKICVHGTTHCTLVKNVMVDTGSVGLRLQDDVLSGLPLPNETMNGNKVAECFSFTGSNVWGDVKTADVYFGDLKASGLAIQVANKRLARPADKSCKDDHFTPASNGTLGIGWGTSEIGAYYGCSASGCTPLPLPLPPAGVKLVNPVSALPGDNNGEVFELPKAAASVTSEVKGWLILGVNTETNNQIGMGTDSIIKLDKYYGDFTTSLLDAKGNVVSSYSKTYIDSGTQTFGFYAPSLSKCSDRNAYYCIQDKIGLLDLGVAATGGGSAFTTEMRISTQPGPSSGKLTKVYDDLVYRSSSTAPKSFVWGLPFFLEKRVALVQSDSMPAAMPLAGPFYAFRNYEGPGR